MRHRLLNQRWRRALGVVLSAGLVAVAPSCASAPRAAAPAEREVVDTIWYISARARESGQDSRRLTDTLEYGLAIYARPRIADPLHDALDVRLIDSTALSVDEFVGMVSRRIQRDTSSTAHAVYYLHGFGTSLHEGWQYAEEARVRTRATAPWIVFCWPANGAGIDWPRSGQWLTRAYHDDMELARASVPAFVRGTAVVLQAVPHAQLIVAAHSLGGTLLGDAITAPLGLRTIIGEEPLRALAFIAPDVSADAFRERIAPAAASVAARRVLYLSSRDRVLAMARMVHDSTALSVDDGPALVRAGVDVIDASDGFVAEGWMQGLVGTHHAIRRVSATLFDLSAVVGARRGASCRERLATAVRSDDGVWRLTAQRPPANTASAVCAAY